MVPDDAATDSEPSAPADRAVRSADSDPVSDPDSDPVSDAGSDGFLSPGDDAPATAAEILIYGVLGGVAGSVLSFIPFATVVGGAAAGYFCGGTSADGLKTGAVAGLVMTLPFVAVVAFVLFLLGFGGAPTEFGVLALLVVGFGAAYTLGSGVVGGYLGHYLRGEL